jgi:hypothetical protein
MQVVLEKHNVTIIYDGSRKRLYQTWNGYLTVNEFVAAIDLSVAYFREYGIETILSDTTNQAVLAKDGAEYAVSVMPALIENGLKRVAFVLPKSFFAKLAVEEFTKNTESQLVGHFASREEAEEWLNKC